MELRCVIWKDNYFCLHFVKGELINMTWSWDREKIWVCVAQWIDYPPAVRDIMGSIPVGNSDFLFVLCLSHSSFADLNMFKRILNAVFADYLHQCLSIYVNDIIMRAQTHHDVLWCYQLLFAQAIKVGRQFKPTKSTLFAKELQT